MDIWRYKQVTCERDLSTDNFHNGCIRYVYKMPSNCQINLNKSFIRMRYRLTKADGTTLLEKADDVAPAYLLPYNIFRQMYHKINGVNVGEIQSYVPQVGALCHRRHNKMSLRTGFLKSTIMSEIDFTKRQNEVVQGGINLNDLKYVNTSALLPALAGTGVVPRFLDIVTPNQIEFIAGAVGAGEIRFTANAGQTIPDLSLYLQVGQPIYYNDGGEVAGRIASFTTTVTTNDTIIPTTAVLVVAAANLVSQFRITEREVDVVASATKQKTINEIIFKPPMGIWQKNSWIASHDMCLELYPRQNGTYQKMAIESELAEKVNNTDFKFQIDDMIMYCAIKDVKHSDGDFNCSYEDIRCQLTNITTTSNVDYHFTVNKDADTFTLSFQDENVENSSLRSATKFKIRNEEELGLERYYITYNGRVLPDPYPQISKSATTDYYTQRYYESNFYSDTIKLQDVENQKDWEEAGTYYTHKFWKTGKRAEKLTLSTLFADNNFAGGHRPNLLLFDHYMRTFKVHVSGGRVSKILADKM